MTLRRQLYAPPPSHNSLSSKLQNGGNNRRPLLQHTKEGPCSLELCITQWPRWLLTIVVAIKVVTLALVQRMILGTYFHLEISNFLFEFFKLSRVYTVQSLTQDSLSFKLPISSRTSLLVTSILSNCSGSLTEKCDLISGSCPISSTFSFSAISPSIF